MKRGSGSNLRHMIICTFIALMAWGFADLAAAGIPGNSSTGAAKIRMAAGEILVRFKTLGIGPTNAKTQRPGKIFEAAGMNVREEISALAVHRIQVNVARSFQEALEELRRDPAVLYAEPNYIAQAMQDPATNDPEAPRQWALRAIHAPEAWAITRGDPAMIVAVVDTGVDPQHPDLVNNLLPGYNFIDDTPDSFDDHGHGTFCAGIIIAEADNGIGIAGVAPRCRLMPLKALDAAGDGTYADVAKAIVYAADHEARVISMSFGGYAYSQTLQDAVDYAQSKGCVLVAAGGNDGLDESVYPAACADVIGVSALGPDGRIWPGSNRGAHIDVCAPGVDILSTALGSGFESQTGTSPAAALVAGCAAIAASGRPDLSCYYLARQLELTAEDMGEPYRDPIYGAGKVNIAMMLTQPIQPFHDLLIDGLRLETAMVSSGEDVYLMVDVANHGTFYPQSARLIVKVNSVLIYDAEVQITGKDKIPVNLGPLVDRTQQIMIEADLIAADDDNPSNNHKELLINSTYYSGGGVHILYSDRPFTHSWICYQAYRSLEAAKPMKSELEANNKAYLWWGGYETPYPSEMCYLFGLTDDSSATNWCWGTRYWDGDYTVPVSWQTGLETGSSIIEGSWEEDQIGLGSEWHFWNPDNNFSSGLYIWKSAPYFAVGAFDSNYWKIAKSNYISNPSMAYYWLGRVAHLLSDMGIPEHVMLEAHSGRYLCWPYDFSNYELFTKTNYRNYRSGQSVNWNQLPLDLPNYSDFPSGYDTNLSALFYNLAQYTQHFDSSDNPGNNNQYGTTTPIPSIAFNIDPQNGTCRKTFHRGGLLDGPSFIDPEGAVWVYRQTSGARQLISLNENQDYFLSRANGLIGLSDEQNSTWGTEDRLYIAYYCDGEYQPLILVPTEDKTFSFVPDNLVKDQADKILPTTISYVAALYDLFWATVHHMTTLSADSITQTSAHLNGWLNPGLGNSGGSSVNYWFEYMLNSSTDWNSAFQTPQLPLASVIDEAQAVQANISGLQCSQTYKVRLVIQIGTDSPIADAHVITFTTVACTITPPTVTTGTVSSLAQTSATLNGAVNPNGSNATAWFEYGPNTAYGTQVPISGNLTGNSAQPIMHLIANLQPGTTYHFRAGANNAGGTNNGFDQTFTTQSAPGNISVTAAPNPVNINQPSTISVIVQNGGGQPPAAGTPVTFSTTYPGIFSGNGASSSSSPSTVVTNSSGNTWIYFASGATGNANITVESPSIGSTIVPLQIVNPSATLNIQVTVQYSSGTSSSTTYFVEAFVKDLAGNPAPNVTLTFSASSGNLQYTTRVTNSQGRSDNYVTVYSSGLVTVTVTSGANQAANTFSAQVGSSSGGPMYPTRTLSMNGTIYGVDYSPDGATLAASTYSSNLKAWNTADYSDKWTGSGDYRNYGQVSISPNGQRLAVATKRGVQERSMANGSLYCEGSDMDEVLVAWLSDSMYADAGSSKVYRFNSPCGSSSTVGTYDIFAKEGHIDQNSNKNWFSACDLAGTLHVWTSGGSSVANQFVDSGAGYDCDFSSDGGKIVATSDQVIRVFNTSTWSSTTYSAPSVAGTYRSVVFIDNNTKLAVGGNNGMIEVLDLNAGGASFRTASVYNAVFEMAWNPVTQELAAGTSSGALYIFKPLAPVDTFPPTISVSTPLDSAVTNQASIASTGRVTDNMSVSSFTINGTTVGLDGSGNFSTTVNLVEGPNTITYIAKDPPANTATMERTVTRLVDRVPPTIENASVDPSIGPAGTIFTIHCAVTDGDSGVASVTARITDAAGATVTSRAMVKGSGSNWSATYDSTGAALGNYGLDIIAVDSSPQANSRTLTNASGYSIVPPCPQPGAFALSAPTNGATLAMGTTTATLTWNAAANATSYDVYFGTSSPPYYVTNLTETSLTVTVGPNAIYYWKVVARVSCNSNQTSVAGPWSFTVPPDIGPIVTTGAASNVVENSATLHGSINPNSKPTTAWFQYGPTSSYGKKTAVQSLTAGSIAVPISANIVWLQCGSTYHCRLVGQNSDAIRYGEDQTFTTGACTYHAGDVNNDGSMNSTDLATVKDVLAGKIVPGQHPCLSPLSADFNGSGVLETADCTTLTAILAGSQTVPTCTSPSITNQPASQTIQNGQIATMTVTATGTALCTYQWYQGTSPNTSSPISGATGTSYTTPVLNQTMYYWVRVRNACGAADSNTATITVITPPRGSLQFKSAAETIAEDGGSFRIYVSRTGGTFGAAGVNYATADGTAVAGADYTATSGTLSWADGDAADKFFDVTILDDSAVETSETFTVNLNGPSGASLGSPFATTVTIIDNEPSVMPIAWYSFDVPGLPGKDVAGGYDAVSVIGVTQVSGKIGQAGSFTDGYMMLPEVPAFMLLSGDFTLSVFVKGDVNPNNRNWFVKSSASEYMYGFGGDDTIGFSFHGGSAGFGISTTNVFDQNWHHVAGVKRGNTGEIWIDGTMETSFALNINYTEVGSFAIGRLGMCCEEFNGLMDEAKIWNVALTAEQIATEAGSVIMPGEVHDTDSIVGYLRYAPADSFIQGSSDTEPCRGSFEIQFTHTLTRSLAVMETEVNRQMWADLKAVQTSLPNDPTDTYFGSGMTNPVQCVTWYQAVLFANLLSLQQGLTRCYYTDISKTTPITGANYNNNDTIYCDFAANGFRLPTSGEFEYFRRAGTQTMFWFNEPAYDSDTCAPCASNLLPELEAREWTCLNAGNVTHPVGTKAVNPWNLWDVSGNVWEWCWDWYTSTPTIGDKTDYTGPTAGTNRILRGGAFDAAAVHSRSANYVSNTPSTAYISRGFRLVKSLP